MIAREGGDIGLFITLVHNVFKNVFLILWSFYEFGYFIKCPNVSTIICNLQKGLFCYSGSASINVYCLIPLYPCMNEIKHVFFQLIIK